MACIPGNCRFGGVAHGALVLVLAISGCGGQPQVGAENVRLIESLRTAVSARRTDWLEENAQVVERRRQSGQLDEASYETLHAIIEQARSSHWEDAEAAVLALAKGQEGAEKN